MVIDPYEADPSKIPVNDLYADLPFYGRYFPQDGDFHPDLEQIDSVDYWSSVLEKCDASNCLYESIDGGRDVFALGSVIIKASHLRTDAPRRNYTIADANEVAAIKLVKDVLRKADVLVPNIYFAGKVKEREILVQSRIPGVTLNVAWPYLSKAQKASFKAQARRLLHLLHGIQAPDTAPSYVVRDSDPMRNRNITELESALLFGSYDQASGSSLSDAQNKADCSLAHNDFNESNIIVSDDRIVGIVDWEMAGWFGWRRAGAVHSRCRAPKREDFSRLDLGEERLADLTYWNDLYDANKAEL